MTTIKYFIPEDGDSEVQPNVFLAPKPRQQGYPPTLAELKSAFPLPGRYHFRFKSPLVPGADREKSAMPVWMDCTDDRQYVPTWRNTIVAKVSRVGIEDDDDDDDEDFQRPAAAPTAQVRAPAPAPPPQAPAAAPRPSPPPTQPSVDFFGMGTTGSGTQSTTPASANLLDGGAPQAAPAQDNLFDMNYTGTGNTGSAPSSGQHDFFGMSGTTTPPVSGYHNQQQQQGNNYPGGQSGPFF